MTPAELATLAAILHQTSIIGRTDLPLHLRGLSTVKVEDYFEDAFELSKEAERYLQKRHREPKLNQDS